MERWGQKPLCSGLESEYNEYKQYFREILSMKRRKEEKARETVLLAEGIACVRVPKCEGTGLRLKNSRVWRSEPL